MRILVYLLVLFIFVSCSNSDDITGAGDSLPVVSVLGYNPLNRSVSEPNEVSYLFLNSSGEVTKEDMLSTNHDVHDSFRYYYKEENKITFFFRESDNPNNYSFIEYYTDSNFSTYHSSICETSPGHASQYLPWISGNYTLHTSSIFENGTTFYLDIMDSDGLCRRVAMDTFQGYYSRPDSQVFNDYFYFYFQGENLTGHLIQVDLKNAEVRNKTQVNAPFKGVITENAIHVYEQNGIHTKIDVTNFNVTSAPNSTVNLWSLLDFGFTNAVVLNDNQIFTSNGIPYPQPGILSSGPAILDLKDLSLTKGENAFLYDVFYKILEEIPEGFYFTTYAYNPNTRIIVAGYGKIGENTGGLAYFDFEGTLYKTITLETIPQAIWVEE